MLVLEAFTTQTVGPVAAACLRKLGTRRERRRFDLRRVRFKRAAMRVERDASFAKPINRTPSFMDGSCAMANLMNGAERLCAIARPCQANETTTITMIRCCLTALQLSRPIVPARHEVGKDQGCAGWKTFIGRTGQDCNGRGCRLGTFQPNNRLHLQP
jgi:hypothetical protein